VKASIIGTGHVGATLAFALVVKGVCDDIVLVNRTHRKAEGEAADLQHAAAFVTRAIAIEAGDIDATANSDVVIMCLSAPQDANSRDRTVLAEANAALLREWIKPLVDRSPNGVLVIVTNPVDAMTYLAWQLSGLPPGRVIGTGTLIDSARFRSYLSAHLQIHPDDIRTYVLGEHGATQFPALSVAATGGARIDNDPAIARLFERTISSAHEIFEIKGYTNYAIALATTLIVESILHDSHRTLPVSTLLQGFEEQHEVCLSIPAVIGRAGVVRQLHPQLNQEESRLFRASADEVRRVIAKIV
jgi:L-lactate dehydrogenase